MAAIPQNTIDGIREREAEEKAAIEMVQTYQKKNKKVKLYQYKVEGDPCHTVFFVRKPEQGAKKVEGYKREHAIFWK